jgi:hypothetical protein
MPYGWIYEGEVMTGVVDASVVTLPDGTYRMYYGSWRSWPIGEHQRDPYIGYASSRDGLKWTDEGETGLSGGWPRVIQLPDGRWRMYYGGHPGIAVAISADGLVWQKETLSGIEPSQVGVREYGGVDVVTLPDGTYRMYYSEVVPSDRFPVTGVSRIMSAVSEDGLNWQVEPGVRIDPLEGKEGPLAQHPRVITQPDGGYKMFYWTADSTIWSATSEDGLTWGNRRPEHVFGADPEVMMLPDGRMRMFVNWLDATFSTAQERQRMWSYVWDRLPFVLMIPPKVKMRPGQMAEVTLEIKGEPGDHVSLSAEVYSQGVYEPDDPSSPFRIELSASEGTVPFTVKVTLVHQTKGPMATVVLTGDNGDEVVRLPIAVQTTPQR